MIDPLEELLRRQTLDEPSGHLDRRVRRLLRTRRARLAWAPWGRPAAVAAALAAGLLAMLYWMGRPTPEKPGGPVPLGVAADVAADVAAVKHSAGRDVASAHPVRLEYRRSVLVDGGLIVLEDNTPVRQYRCQTIRRLFWHDPAQNIRIQADVPCEQVVWVRESTY